MGRAFKVRGRRWSVLSCLNLENTSSVGINNIGLTHLAPDCNPAECLGGPHLVPLGHLDLVINGMHQGQIPETVVLVFLIRFKMVICTASTRRSVASAT